MTAMKALLLAAGCVIIPLLVTPTLALETNKRGGGLEGLDEIPPFGLGTWLSDRDKVAHAVEFALKAGYNHIDAALIYRNENQTGQGIAASGVRRKDIWVTSKLWNTDHRRDRAKAAINQSITDLGVGYLDLYLMHWPVAFVPDSGKTNKIDRHTSILDTWRTMEDLVRANLTKYIGISNFARHDVEHIMAHCDICPYAHELETHPYLQQQDFVDFHKDIGVKIIAYSPLANTNPTYRDGGVVGSILDDPLWQSLARKKGTSVAQTVLAWGLQRGTVVIPKSTSEAHIVENRGAVGVEFSDEEMAVVANNDRKTRMNDPGRKWGVRLFSDLDCPTKLGDDEVTMGEL